MKDCDNMAKGLADAFQGLLYVNDSQIEHLDLFKVHGLSAGTGSILVRCSPARLNDQADVVAPDEARIVWMTADSLNLGRFLAAPQD